MPDIASSLLHEFQETECSNYRPNIYNASIIFIIIFVLL